MAAWSRTQRFDPIVTITDKGGKAVGIEDIKREVATIVAQGTTEQLIVYFAGHGINVAGAERWLLSGAPQDSGAAVNLEGSVELAYHCGIDHVVFISDACRTAAKGIQAQRVKGGDIFPNEAPSGAEKAVDQFWACLVGNPALEVEDSAVAVEEYRALYTDELLDALRGTKLDILELDGNEVVVHPHRLKRSLPTAVAERIRALKMQGTPIQIPDARITSEPQAWLARHAPPFAGWLPTAQPQGRRGLGLRLAEEPAENVEAVSAALLRNAVSRDNAGLAKVVDRARVSGVAGTGPSSTLTRACTSRSVRVESTATLPSRSAERASLKRIPSTAGWRRWRPGIVLLDRVARPGTNVLLVFAEGSGAVLPAIPGFIGALTVEHGAVVDVIYEPVENSDRGRIFQSRAPGLRALSAVAASATRNGVFRLDGKTRRRWRASYATRKAAYRLWLFTRRTLSAVCGSSTRSVKRAATCARITVRVGLTLRCSRGKSAASPSRRTTRCFRSCPFYPRGGRCLPLTACGFRNRSSASKRRCCHRCGLCSMPGIARLRDVLRSGEVRL